MAWSTLRLVSDCGVAPASSTEVDCPGIVVPAGMAGSGSALRGSRVLVVVLLVVPVTVAGSSVVI
jgi:hypothetical protein